MAKVTGGELVARGLAREGVSFLFGLPCPELDPLLAALEPNGIRFVPVRHESAAVHMAEGLYKTTGRVAAVAGNPGPGSLNLIPGVVTARHEGVPVLVITAQHRPEIVYPSLPSTFQGQDQLDLFKPAVKWGAPIFQWKRIPEVMNAAFREMWAGRPGPVHLELPGTLLYEEGEAPSTSMRAPENYRASPPLPNLAQIEQAARMLAEAERPLVIAGSGVDRAGANGALLGLVERLNCPVLATMAGRSAVPTDHPNLVYGFGAGGDAARLEADVVLVAGSRLGNLDLPYDRYWGDPAHHRLIQIDVEPRHIGVTRPVTLGIVADAGPALEALGAALDRLGAKPRDGAELARVRRVAADWWRKQFEAVSAWNAPGIHPAHAAQAVGRAFGSDAIYVTDGGMTSLWSHWFLPSTRPRSYLSILELGMLGTGIPSAIGAKLGSPEREVVCVTGDGAAGFNAMELQSAAREKLELTFVVFAEGAWTMEEPNELARYGRTFGTRMGDVDWATVARGLGCYGETVTTLAELAPALERARRAKGPRLVCVRTSAEANVSAPLELFTRFGEVYGGPRPGSA
jgi:acetolactate synthase-1/2/3 large subunit